MQVKIKYELIVAVGPQNLTIVVTQITHNESLFFLTHLSFFFPKNMISIVLYCFSILACAAYTSRDWTMDL